MHRKVDQIASYLGISLYHPGMEQLSSGGSGRRVHRRNVGVPPLESSMGAMQQSNDHGMSGVLAQDVSMLP